MNPNVGKAAPCMAYYHGGGFVFPASPHHYSLAKEYAGELSIAPARVAVAGDSASGQLATVVCLMAKERGQIMPCAQMLVYPAAGNVEAESLAELPAAYIETAEFDCLRDGGILYVERLRQSGVSVTLYNTEGTMHGFDIVLDSQIVRKCVDKRISFLRRHFLRVKI